MEFSQIRLVFQAFEPTSLEFKPRLNIAPSFRAGHEVPIVIPGPLATRELHLSRFWLVPEHWRKPLEALPPTFNARAETVFQKPLFRDAIRRGRCLVPATGWREFQNKQPYHFVPTSPSFLGGLGMFAFAGIHCQHFDADGNSFRSFAIVTRKSTPGAVQIHDRMPLLLPTHLYADWLSSTSGADVLSEAIAASDKLELSYFPSDPTANSPRYEGPRATSPLPELERSAAKNMLTSPQMSLFRTDEASDDGAPTTTIEARAAPRKHKS